MATGQAASPRAVNSLDLLPLVGIMVPNGMDRGLSRVGHITEAEGLRLYGSFLL